MGGAHNWEGRVEILWNGAWGTISDSSLDLSEAKTICKQLGLPHAESKLQHYVCITMYLHVQV